MVIALKGELGSGKTTFVQKRALELGIKEVVTSPTFVILKIYDIPDGKFKRLVHIDAYRLEDKRELEALGIKELMEDKDNLVMIEWADKFPELIPNDAEWLTFTHEKNNIN